MQQVLLTFDDDQYEKLKEVCDFSSQSCVREITRAVALMAYRAGRISLAKAAEVAGSTLWEMVDELRAMGLPVHDYSDEDWEAEQAAVEGLRTSCALGSA